MKKSLLLAFVSLLIRAIQGVNLLCNGDFQNYTLIFVHSDKTYSQFPSNLSCWYAAQTTYSYFEVDRLLMPYSQLCRLYTFVPYHLCQKVSLVIGRNYSLQYTMYCPIQLKNMTFTIKINSIKIAELSIANPDTKASGSTTFIATQSNTQICFNESHSIVLYQLDTGGLIDNVSLTQIPISSNTSITNTSNATNIISNTTSNVSSNSTSNATFITTSNISSVNTSNEINSTITPVNDSISSIPPSIPSIPSIPNAPIIDGTSSSNNPINGYSIQQQQAWAALTNYSQVKQTFTVNFKTETRQQSWQIVFESDFPFYQWLSYYFKKKIQIYFEGELQKQLRVLESENHTLTAIVRVYRAYQLNQIQMYLEAFQTQRQYIDFQIYLDGKKIIFHMLEKETIDLIQKIKPVGEAIANATYEISNTMASLTSSYFVLSLIEFWNLSLMYNFLLINTIPNFSRNIYEIIIKLIYKRINLSQWIVNNLNLSSNFFDFELENQMPEHMEQFKEGFSWFGTYGISSKLIDNNKDVFILLSILLLKLLLIKFLFLVCSAIFSRIFQINSHLAPIFCCELILSSPFIILGALESMVNSDITSVQKFESMFLIILAFFVIISFFIYLLLKIRQLTERKKELRILFKEEKINSLTEGEKAEFILEGSHLILNFSIPGCIFFNHPLSFFIINTLVIYSGFFFYIWFFRALSLKQKIFYGISQLIWLVHHSTFFILFIISQIYHNSDDKNTLNEISINCGVISLYTIIIGAIFSLQRFLIECLLYLKRIIKKFWIIWKYKTEIFPKKSNNQKEQDPNIKQVQTIEVEQKALDQLPQTNVFAENKVVMHMRLKFTKDSIFYQKKKKQIKIKKEKTIIRNLKSIEQIIK